jgi:signal peptidase I
MAVCTETTREDLLTAEAAGAPRQVLDPETAAAGALEADAGAGATETASVEAIAEAAIEAAIGAAAEAAVEASAEAAAEARRRSFGRRFWRDLLVAAGVVVCVHVFLVQISVVRGSSMAPSLRDGDRLVVDRVSYSVGEVDRFDVVVLRYPRDPGVDFVKRIVGLPGDVIELQAGLVRVNGDSLPEDFAHINDGEARGRWVVPRDSYFVLGDNRPISCDSREFGMVTHDLLKGKVRLCFWPLDRFSLF